MDRIDVGDDSSDIWSQKSRWQRISTGAYDGVAPNMQHAIICSNILPNH